MKLSIIIPVYNVKPYIDRCLRSIITQIPDDVEVILIDDGSTDGSAIICDQYASDYSYITVIHQANAGLSSARNTGLRYSHGDYVFFVDSDDYLNPQCLSNCLNAIASSGCDVVIFSYNQVDEHGRVIDNNYYLSRFPDTQTVSGSDALRFLLEERYQNISWDMISARSIWLDNHISFPEGKKYEDIATTYKILIHAQIVMLLHESLYYYVQRSESITHALTAQALEDQLAAFTIRSQEIARANPSLRVLCEDALYKAHYATVTATTTAEKTYEVKNLRNQSIAYLRMRRPMVHINKLFSMSQQIILYFILLGLFPFVESLIRIVKHVRKRN